MKENIVIQYKDYLSRKNRFRRKFELDPWMYDSMEDRHGRWLNLYDVQERYRFGGNKVAHKIIEDEFSYRES